MPTLNLIIVLVAVLAALIWRSIAKRKYETPDNNFGGGSKAFVGYIVIALLALGSLFFAAALVG